MKHLILELRKQVAEQWQKYAEARYLQGVRNGNDEEWERNNHGQLDNPYRRLNPLDGGQKESKQIALLEECITSILEGKMTERTVTYSIIKQLLERKLSNARTIHTTAIQHLVAAEAAEKWADQAGEIPVYKSAPLRLQVGKAYEELQKWEEEQDWFNEATGENE